MYMVRSGSKLQGCRCRGIPISVVYSNRADLSLCACTCMQTRRTFQAGYSHVRSWLRGALAAHSHGASPNGSSSSGIGLREPLMPSLRHPANTPAGLADTAPWDQQEIFVTSHLPAPWPGRAAADPEAALSSDHSDPPSSQDISGFTVHQSQLLGTQGNHHLGFCDKSSDGSLYPATSAEALGMTGLLPMGYEAVSTGDSAAGKVGFTRRVHPAPPSWPAGSTTTTVTATSSSRAASELPLGFKPYFGDPLGLVGTSESSGTGGSAGSDSNSSRVAAGEEVGIAAAAAAAGVGDGAAGGIMGCEPLTEYAAVPGSLVRSISVGDDALGGGDVGGTSNSNSSGGSKSTSAPAAEAARVGTVSKHQAREKRLAAAGAAAAGTPRAAAACYSRHSSSTSSGRSSSATTIAGAANVAVGDNVSSPGSSRAVVATRVEDVEARTPLLPREAQRSCP